MQASKKILIAPDSFKGSLTAQQICDTISRAAHDVCSDVAVQTVALPMADGGEGTVEAVIAAVQGTWVSVQVHSPDQRMITAQYGIFENENGRCAIMAMAQASGITCVAQPVHARDIFSLNTFGTGEMLCDALNHGVQTIYIGIGGSATNDGGIGFASALGAQFLDANGAVLPPIPANFDKICTIDTSRLDSRLQSTKIFIMSDVTNVLLGDTGATAVFSAQKGAKPHDMAQLEHGMAHLADCYATIARHNIAMQNGAGAAGGLGAALLTFTNAIMQSGVQTVLDILHFDAHLQGADLVITGEGRMDGQSAFGKVACGVGERCKAQGIPCIAVVGGLGEGYQAMYDHGITSMVTTVDGILSLEQAIEHAEKLCYQATARALQLIAIDW